jgi:hypothetical protein
MIKLPFLKSLFQKRYTKHAGGKTMTFKENQSYVVYAFCNNEFLLIETYLVFGRAVKDYDVQDYYLSPNADDKSIGETVLLALSQSRTLTSRSEKGIEYFDWYGVGKQKNEEWEKSVMKKYGYKTKRAMFEDMKSCDIELENGIITIGPSNHEKLKGWSGNGLTKDDYVVLPLDSSLEEIGAGLKLAFSRCI